MAMTIDEAVALVSKAIGEAEPGPESYAATGPASVNVDWDYRLSSARASKLASVRSAVRSDLPLHQMPQVLLVAEDGAVMGIFGLDTGMRVQH